MVRSRLVVRLAMALLLWPGTAGADQLDVELLARAPNLLEALYKKGYRTIGVLPFAVQLPHKTAAQVDPLSSNLADRVETALVILLPGKGTTPLTILHRAGKAAADRDRDAGQATPPARRKLFAASYPAAWGKARVRPDVFLTGTALFEDLDSLKLSVGYFDAKADQVVELQRFPVRVDRQVLADAGFCFALPAGMWKGRALKSRDLDALAVEQALSALRKRAQPEHLSIGLEVRTAERSQPLELTTGPSGHRQAAVGSAYALGLRRTDGGDHKLGVVLKVGGRSLWQAETAQFASCRRWVYTRKSARADLYEGVYADATGKKFDPLRPPSPTPRSPLAGLGDNLVEAAVLASGPEGYEEGGRVCLRGLPEEERTEANTGTLDRLRAALMRRSGVKVKKALLTPRAFGGLNLAELEADDGSRPSAADFPRPMLVEYTRIDLVPTKESGEK